MYKTSVHFRRAAVSGARASLFVLGLLGVTAAPASAHISLEKSGTHESRYGDSELKDGPCGMAGGKRGTNVYTYESGETITVKITETIPHPGYFRIAFDEDGDDGFVDPVSIKPQLESRGCPCSGCDAAADHCDKSDFYNTPEVLEGMDNLDPHTTLMLNKEYTWQVKLPDVECDNCTLQIIQVMEDPLGHGPYDGKSDVYHQCIDLVLKRPAGSQGADAGAGDAKADTKKSDGCSAAGSVTESSTLPSVLLALALCAVRRRRTPRA